MKVKNFGFIVFLIFFYIKGSSQPLFERKIIDTSNVIKHVGQSLIWNGKSQSAINFFDYIEKSEKSFSMNTYEIKGKYYKIYIPRTNNFKSVDELGGVVSIFAVPKRYPNKWMLEVTDGKNTSEKIRILSFKLWDKPFSRLKEEFELYAFFINKRDLEPYKYDSDVEGTTIGYETKKGAEVTLYKYSDENYWYELDRIKQYNDLSSTQIGRDYYIKEFSLNKIRVFIETK